MNILLLIKLFSNENYCNFISHFDWFMPTVVYCKYHHKLASEVKYKNCYIRFSNSMNTLEAT